MLLFCAHSSSSASVATPPAGWTPLTVPHATAADFSLTAFYRVYQAGDPDLTVEWDSTGGVQTDVVAYYDVDDTTPIAVAEVVSTGGTTTNTYTWGPVTVPTDGLFVVYATADAGGSGRPWSESGAMTERIDQQTSTHWHVVADEAVSGSVSRDLTIGGSAQHMAGYVVALAPAASTPGTVTGTGTLVAPVPTLSGSGTVTTPPSLLYRMVGAPTPTSMGVSARITGSATSVRLAVSTDPGLASPTYFGPVGLNASSVAEFSATGLTASTTYYYGIEMDSEMAPEIGSFRTAPAGAANFSFTWGSCQRSNIEGDAWTRMAAHDPDFVVVTGDFAYMDITTNDPGLFRTEYDERLATNSPTVGAFLADVPLVYTWSDHDFGENSAGAASPSAPAAQQVYREVVPHPPLVDAAAIYHAFTYGRVRFVVTDERSFMSPAAATDDASKTILGATQKQWFKDQITDATEPVIVWVGDSTWLGPVEVGGDGWQGFDTERQELAAFLATAGKVVVRLGGDTHAMGADDGTNAPGGIVTLNGSPFSNTPSTLPGTWSHGYLPAVRVGDADSPVQPRCGHGRRDDGHSRH